MINLKNKRVAVYGIAETGKAVVRALLDLGAYPVAFEDSNEERQHILQSAYQLRDMGIQVHTDCGKSASSSGFDLIIPSPGIPREHPFIKSAIENNIPLWSEPEFAYQAARCPIIAITGSNGKSTVTAWIHEILLNSGIRSHLCGNIAGIAREQPLISAAIRAKANDILTAEISSFQLDWVVDFKPKVGVITVIQPDHLNRYDNNFEFYARTKFRLIAKQDETDYAILNADDPIQRNYEPNGKQNIRQFTMSQDGSVTVYLENDAIILTYNDQTIHLIDTHDIKLKGKHNIANAMASALAAILMGADLTAVRKTLRLFPGLPHRMEYVGKVNGVDYINNSMCTNPAAAVASISTLDKPAIVIAGGKNKGLDFTPFAEIAEDKIKYLLLIGSDAGDIAEPLSKVNFNRFEMQENMPDALRKASELAEPGDTIILAPGCASFGEFTSFRERGDKFRELVKAMKGDSHG